MVWKVGSHCLGLLLFPHHFCAHTTTPLTMCHMHTTCTHTYNTHTLPPPHLTHTDYQLVLNTCSQPGMTLRWHPGWMQSAEPFRNVRHTHTCIHIYAHTHTHMCVHAYVCMCTCTHAHTHMHAHTHAHTHTYTHMHAHTHTYTHSHTYTHFTTEYDRISK